jgi:predicted metal-dependent enzyme (double-stranded beta helix superfamily)
VFDVDTLIADCKAAIDEGEPHRAVREILERTMAGTGATAVGDTLQPKAGGLDLLYVADDLTVLHVVWSPGMRLFPHDHRMWAAIGIYAGQEDNTFYRRTEDDRTTVTESGGKELHTGDVLLLGKDAIHAVTNPLERITGAIHVYGGDFVNKPRSQWGPGPPVEQPYDFDVVEEQFAEANAKAGLNP